jgi:hypothetical protein
MSFDATQHEIDPKTGFMVDKDTGHRVGLEQAPAPKPVMLDNNWPAWVPVHESYVVRHRDPNDHGANPDKKPDGPVMVVQGFKDWHVNRHDGSVMVLVDNEDEAKVAGAEKPEQAEADKSAMIDPDIRKQVHAEVEAEKARLMQKELDEKAAAQAEYEEQEALKRTEEKRALEAAAKQRTVPYSGPYQAPEPEDPPAKPTDITD